MRNSRIARPAVQRLSRDVRCRVGPARLHRTRGSVGPGDGFRPHAGLDGPGAVAPAATSGIVDSTFGGMKIFNPSPAPVISQPSSLQSWLGANKNKLLLDLKCNIAFVYSSDKILSYNEINKSLIEVLNKISIENE